MIIPNGVGSEYSRGKRTAGDGSRLVFLSRIVPRKGLLLLLQAVHELSGEFPDLHLTVIGDGPQLNQAREFVREKNLRNQVLFTGELYDDAKTHHLRTAHVFCAPYKNEAFGMTLLEGMACGCATLGFWEDGYTDFLEGYLVCENVFPRKRGVPMLKKAIRRYIGHPERIAAAQDFGLQSSDRFRWPAVAKTTVQFYREVL